MKTIYKAFLLIISFLPFSTIAQQRWEVYLGNPTLKDYPISVKESYDKGYLITNPTSDLNSTLIKTSINGVELWTKTFLSDGNPYLINMDEDSLGGKIIVGDINSPPLIIYINSCGEKVWCSRIINEQKFQHGQFLNVKIHNGSIYALADFMTNDDKTAICLFNFNLDGELLWMQQYANVNNDPNLDFVAGIGLDIFPDACFISGFCYYSYPEDPGGYYLRPMFIKLDENFNEEWFLPYGMHDSITGDSRGVIKLNDSTYRGYGFSYVKNSDTLNSTFMDFDNFGQETENFQITNKSISPEVEDNYLFELEVMNDTSYMISARVGNTLYDNPMGEWSMNPGGLVYSYQNHANTLPATFPLSKTFNDKYVFSVQYQNESNKDILLYKLNPDLSQADIDTTSYVYDSLCDHPIVSDTIYLDDCGIITDLRDVPSPSEYYSYISTIPIHIFPNPASSGITFEFENTEYHKDIVLRCYDINGRMIFEETLSNGQTQVKTSVSGWGSGIYIATASSRKGGTGKEKFVVR